MSPRSASAAALILLASGCLGSAPLENEPLDLPDIQERVFVDGGFVIISNETIRNVRHNVTGTVPGRIGLGGVFFAACDASSGCKSKFVFPTPGLITKANVSLEWQAVDPATRSLEVTFGPLEEDAWRFRDQATKERGESPLILETAEPLAVSSMLGVEVSSPNPLILSRPNQPFSFSLSLYYQDIEREGRFSLNLTPPMGLDTKNLSENRTAVSFAFRGETQSNGNPLDGSFWGCALTPGYAAGQPGCSHSLEIRSPWSLESAHVAVTWVESAPTNSDLTVTLAPYEHGDGLFRPRADTLTASGPSPLILETKAGMAWAPVIRFTVKPTDEDGIPFLPPHPEQPFLAEVSFVFVRIR